MGDSFIGTSPFLEALRRLLPSAIENENPYRILNLEQDADEDAVNKAYRSLARKYHPDKLHSNDKGSRGENIFLKIKAAHIFLKETSNRQVLDSHLNHLSERRSRLKFASSEKQAFRDALNKRENDSPIKPKTSVNLISNIRKQNEDLLRAESARLKKQPDSTKITQDQEHLVVIKWKSKSRQLTDQQKIDELTKCFHNSASMSIDTDMVSFTTREAAILATLKSKNQNRTSFKAKLVQESPRICHTVLSNDCVTSRDKPLMHADAIEELENSVIKNLLFAAKRQKRSASP